MVAQPHPFGWDEKTTHALVEFVTYELSENVDHIEQQLLIIRRAASAIGKEESPIFYLATDHNGRPLGRRNLRKEIWDCIHHLQRQQERQPKPQGISRIEWVLMNVAPFFTHTHVTATKNVGRISWRYLASFLDSTINYRRHPDTIRKQYGAVSRGEYPLDHELAYLYDCLKRRREKKSLRKRSAVLHEQAAKRFLLLTKISGAST